GGGPLLLDLGLGLGRGDHPPHPVEGVHVEGQVVDLAVVVGDGAVGVPVELGKLPHIGPHLPGGGVEDVRAVAVDVDPLHRLGVDVAGNVAAPVDDQAAPAGYACLVGEHRAEQPGAHDQVIILLHTDGSSHTDSVRAARIFLCLHVPLFLGGAVGVDGGAQTDPGLLQGGVLEDGGRHGLVAAAAQALHHHLDVHL